LRTKIVNLTFSRITPPKARKRHASRLPPLPILLILLLSFFLRTYRLDNQALRGDEAATVHYAAFPITGLWELSRVTDPHPPLYYLMLHPWQWLVGESAWAMRFAGVAAGVLAVAILYTLARRTLHAAGASLFAATLLTINPFQIWLAQDVRNYPFFTLFGLLSSWALWRALNSQPSAISRHSTSSPTPDRLRAIRFLLAPHPPPLFAWLFYILFTVVCLYIHYYTVFLIAFQGIFVLLNFKKFWDRKLPWIASQVAIGLLIIPGLQLAYNFIGQAAGGIDTIPTTEILHLASAALLTGFTIDASRSLWTSLLLAPVWLVGLLTLLRRNFTAGTFWGLFFAVPVLGVIALSINRPFFKERFLVQAQPAFELLLAVGFLTLWQTRNPEHIATETSRITPPGARKRHASRITHHAWHLTSYVSRFTFHALRPAASLLLLATLLYVNLFSLSNYFTNPAYAKAPPWHLYHDYVSDKARPGDVMLTNFPEAAVSYYSPNELPFYVVPAERDRSVEFRLEQTEQIANAYTRIWFLPLLRQGFDEQGDVLNWLDRHADRVNQIFFPIYNLNLYLSPPTIEAKLINYPVPFAHGLHLRGYQIFDEAGDSRLTRHSTPKGETYFLTLAPGDEFTLSLYWLADGPTPVPYTVFTHLIAPDGFNQTSYDNQPVWGTYPTTDWSPGEKVTDKYTLTIPEGTPPGDCRLRLGWYRADTLERVPVLDDEAQPVGDHVILNVIIQVE
jgi:4-amino-4-deoxy-L-arabinose transferase-like glycosyltransferase